MQLTADSQDTVTQLCSEAYLLLVPGLELLSRLLTTACCHSCGVPVTGDCNGNVEQIAADNSVTQLFSCIIPVTNNRDGVVEGLTAGCSFQVGSPLFCQQWPHTAEHPDGSLQVHQLVVQGSPLRRLLQIPRLQSTRACIVDQANADSANQDSDTVQQSRR